MTESREIIEELPCVGMLCCLCQRDLGVLILKSEVRYKIISDLLDMAETHPICPKCLDKSIKLNLR